MLVVYIFIVDICFQNSLLTRKNARPRLEEMGEDVCPLFFKKIKELSSDFFR